MVSGRAFVAVLMLCCGSLAHGQALSGAALVEALRHGGYVVVMRHAHAPDAPPSAQDADPGNTKDERQLDAGGRAAAQGMGAALRALHLPVGAVWSSPTYRARQTARLAGLRNPKIAAELGDNGRSMTATTGDQAGWLKALASRRPRARTDTFVVTQYPNIKAAFGDEAADMKDGEALVLRPGAKGPQAVARMAMDQWVELAAPSRHK
jgi:phosphohistidine phosphatase SixA